jgi:hypothetical protein
MIPWITKDSFLPHPFQLIIPFNIPSS